MITQIILVIGFLLSLIGFWGLMTRRDIFRLVIGFSLMDTGVHMIMVGIGYVRNGTAPIFDEAVPLAEAIRTVVDPVPSALVLTAIVIGLAVTALMLSFVVKVHGERNSLSIDAVKELKW